MTVNHVLKSMFKIMDIPEEERKYYVAIRCLCLNAIIWAGKDDIKKRKCWSCGTLWEMDDEGKVTQCQQE